MSSTSHNEQYADAWSALIWLRDRCEHLEMELDKWRAWACEHAPNSNRAYDMADDRLRKWIDAALSDRPLLAAVGTLVKGTKIRHPTHYDFAGNRMTVTDKWIGESVLCVTDDGTTVLLYRADDVEVVDG
jgi:hypothetical protein